MTTKPPEVQHVPAPAQAGRPALHVPAPTQSSAPAQRVLSPGITPADLEQQRGLNANEGRRPTASARGSQVQQPRAPQHVPPPGGPPNPRGAGAGGARMAQGAGVVTQTRGQGAASPSAQHVPNQNARSSPAARQGQHVPDQTASRTGPVPQVPAQQPPPPSSPQSPQVPAPSKAAAPPAPGSFDNAPPIPNTDAEFVSRYRDQARKLRARASRPDVSAEDLAEYEKRATWYESRADVKERGGFMPRALRTPAESVEGADYFRRALVGLLDGIVDLDGPEAGLLAGAVNGADGATITRAAQLFNMWRSGAELLVSLLGVERGAFDPEKPGERWKFRTPNLLQIDAAANVVDAGRVKEDAPPPTSPEATTQAPPPPAADVGVPVTVIAGPGVVRVEDVTHASASTPIVVEQQTSEATPPAASPEKTP